VRVLITGYGGFAGGHLADELATNTDWQLWGTVFSAETEGVGDGATGARPGVVVVPVDLRDPRSTRALIESVAPQLVFHLAGQAFVPAAWADPWGTFETNVRMQINLLEAMARRAPEGRPARVVVISSNEVYGTVPPDQLPIDERRPLAPANPYATSKAAQDLVAVQYGCSHGMDVVRVRPFNHIGPRQNDRFALPAFARQIAEIEAGARPARLDVGNLDAERDFTDVRDVVRGYRLAAALGRAGDVYNLGSGKPRSIRSLVETLLNLSRVAVEIAPDPARARPSEIPRTWCDASKARHELGWRAEIPFEQTVADVLDEWRAKVGVGAPMAAGAPPGG